MEAGDEAAIALTRAVDETLFGTFKALKVTTTAELGWAFFSLACSSRKRMPRALAAAKPGDRMSGCIPRWPGDQFQGRAVALPVSQG